MSATAVRQSYDVHGVGIDVHAEDRAVLEAVQLRLRQFACGRAGAGEIRIEFVNEAPAPRPAGARPVYDTPVGSVHYVPAGDLLHGRLGGVTLHCEPTRGVTRLHCGEFTGFDLYVATHPLLTVSLMELLERRGFFSLHAGCLATAGGTGVVIAGPSGAGKSTLTLALVRAGLAFLSDDVIFLGGDGRVLGFADTIGITEDTARLFPEVAAALGQPAADGFPKRLARVEDLFAVHAASACRPGALVFPQVVADQPSALEPLDPGAALLRLVPDVLLTEAASTQAHLAAIGRLLDQVDCYTVRSGRDLDRAAALVADLAQA